MINNVAVRVKVEQCCGCGTCYNVCPHGAISMGEDEEGFYSPVVDGSKCVNCGLCTRVCPVLNMQYSNYIKPDCYAARAGDEIRMKSSSGGIFSVLAEYILDKGGYVCGAAFDKDWSVYHIVVDNPKSLAMLRGSKYVQSNMGTCYERIKGLLENGKYVLFSGTPCQVAGLHSYLRKQYSKLLTVDVFCIGVPSPGVWKKYLNENFDLNDIVNVNFRDKSKIGWSCSHCTITTKDKKQIVSDNYTKLFHRGIIMRQSCSQCSHAKLPRPGDITLGDFWGIDSYDKALNDHKGLSLVLLNSEKGKALFETVKPIINPVKIALREDYNNGRIRGGYIQHKLRTKFFQNFRKIPYKKILDVIIKELETKCNDTAIMLRNELKPENQTLRDEIDSKNKFLRGELGSGIESIRTQVIKQQTECTRLKEIGQAHSRELVRINTVLREMISLPLTWLNLQRCRLASHLFIGKMRQHYAVKKRRLRESIRKITSFFR